MAVYKPSNCIPFLDTWDLTEEQNISFQVNTNNSIINGYKIKVLDSKNNLIFEGAEYSQIIAYNGDIIELPLIVYGDGESAPNPNVIYYNRDGEQYYKNGGIINNFSNGYVNQPYKWQIILAQGLISDTTFNQNPSDPKYYDMIVSEGTVIGSTPNRIQSKLSEYIYKDYFIQLYDEEDKEISNRVLINSYDHTYGHILPREGQFTQTDINSASYFKIFKNTNQLEYIDTNRIVNNITAEGIKMEKVAYDNGDSDPAKWPQAKWEPSKDTSKYYFIQTYPNVFNPGNIPLAKYCDKKDEVDSAKISGNFNPGETTLLVRGEGDNGLSEYNGVFLFVSSEWKANEGEIDKGTLTIKWMRPATADTWGEFLGQSFYVIQTGENWDSNAKSSGTINSTKLAFYPEEPIEIYPDATEGDNKIRGEIYKTNERVSEAEDIYRIYVRPFIGLEDGMRFKWVKYGDGNVDTGYIDYDKLDTERWCIEYKYSKTEDDKNKPNFTPDTDTYTFVSFFKTSDENPFYGYAAPTVSITAINGVEITDPNFVVNDRIIDVIGSFDQTNNKMWKSFQWSLFDYNYGTTQTSGVKYSGEIRTQFVGLELDHQYELSLAVEDEMGRTNTATFDFAVSNIELSDAVFGDTMQYAFNCELHSVDVSLASEGIIKPEFSKTPLTCGENVICSPMLLCGFTTTERYYNEIYVGKDSDLVGGGLTEPSTGNMTINFETTILSNDFSGDMLQVEVGDIEQSVELNPLNDWIKIKTADLVIIDSNGKRVANEDRYQLYLEYKIDEAPVKTQEKQVVIYYLVKDVLTESSNGWLGVDSIPEVCFGYQPSAIPNEGYDYIVVDLWKDGDKTYKTLTEANGWKLPYNYQSNYEGIPNVAPLENSDANTSAVWSDVKLKQITQPNGVNMQVLTDELNIWSDFKEDGTTPNVWYDEGDYKQYEQVEVTNGTGRQRMMNRTFTFNIVLGNYKYKKDVPVKVVAQCVLSGGNE